MAGAADGAEQHLRDAPRRASSSRTSDADLASVLAATPVSQVREAVDVMQEMGDVLGTKDGLRHFNTLYLDVTSRILERLDEATTAPYFGDEPFLHELDVQFANRYFRAVSNWLAARPQAVPGAWRVYFECRYTPGITEVQFAAAGVNAHINYDLAFALAATWETFQRRKGDTQRADYDKVNDVFEELYWTFRRRFTPDAFDIADHGLIRGVLDGTSAFFVKSTRQMAWDTAKVLAKVDWNPFFGPLQRRARLTKMSIVSEELGAMILSPGDSLPF